MATATETKKTSRTQQKTERAKPGRQSAARSGARASRTSNSKSAGAAKTGARKPAARKSSASRAASARPASRTASRAGKQPSRAAKTTGRPAASAQRAGAADARKSATSESPMAVKMAKSALVGLAGSVAIGAATRAASRRSHRTRLLGVVIPNELKPENLASGLDVKKLSRKIDYSDLLRRIGDAAEAIELRSDEVRTLSGQAKRLSRKLA